MTLVVQVQRHRALQARVRRLSRSVHHVCECVRVCMCSPFARVCAQAAPRACVCSCACTHTQTNTHLQQYVPPHLGQRYDMSPLRVTIKEIRPSFASFITQANTAHPAPSPSPYHLQHVPTHARHVTPAPASAPPPLTPFFSCSCAPSQAAFSSSQVNWKCKAPTLPHSRSFFKVILGCNFGGRYGGLLFAWVKRTLQPR